jgi:hypothetical protein
MLCVANVHATTFCETLLTEHSLQGRAPEPQIICSDFKVKCTEIIYVKVLKCKRLNFFLWVPNLGYTVLLHFRLWYRICIVLLLTCELKAGNIAAFRVPRAARGSTVGVLTALRAGQRGRRSM